jgi:hypothetical protein
MANHKRIGIPGVLMLVMCGLLLGGLLTSSRIQAQDTGDWKPVTIVYNSDIIGKIDPCG